MLRPFRVSQLLYLLALLGVGPTSGYAQGMDQLLAGIQQGGGWVGVPILSGEGVFQTLPLPTLGMTLAGCLKVWGGHSGRWTIQAHDDLGPGRLEADVEPGEPVPFKYTSGMRAQIQVDFQWSEPRDTTLVLWIGLEGPDRRGAKACEPQAQGAG